MSHVLLIISSIALFIYYLLFTYTTLRNSKVSWMAKSGSLIALGFVVMFLYLLVIHDTHIIYLICAYLAFHLTFLLNELDMYQMLSVKRQILVLSISIISILVFNYLL